MNNQATWTCSYCGRVDNTGSTCTSCGANRPQPVYTAPDNNYYAPETVIPQATNSILTAGRVLSGIGTGCAILFLIPFLCAGIFVLGVTVSEWHDYQMLTQNGKTTQATVTSLDSSSSSKSTTYTVRYRFTANDQTYTDSDTVDVDTYDGLETGKKVTIRYAQDDPSISHIGNHDSVALPLFFTVFSVCWNGILLIMVVGFLRRLSRRRRLA